MARLQTRYSYPIMGKPLRLGVTFDQKFHVWERLNMLYGGIQLEDTGHTIRIYRFDGRHRSRLDMSDYDTTYKYWVDDYEYDLDKRMSVLGYVRVWQDDISSHPDQFHVGYHGREITYDLDTTNPDLHVPALFLDVWTLSIRGHGTIGPFSQTFRIDARTYAPMAEKFFYWFDMTPFPSVLPYDHIGFPIAVGCSPLLQNLTQTMTLSAARLLMSCSEVVILDAWRVQNETGGSISPEEYYVLNNTLSDQVFNFFFGCWTTTGLPTGYYRVRFRLNLDVGPPGKCGGMSSQNTSYVDYWKQIIISKNSISTLPTPISIPYDILDSVPVASNLYPYQLYYDEGGQRFHQMYASSVSQFHEPRNLVPDYAVSYNPQEIVNWTTETSATTASDYYLEYPALTDCNPMVFFNGALQRPSVPVDGSVVALQGDYKIVGNKLTSLGDSWGSMSVSYARKGFSFTGGNKNEYFDVNQAQVYDTDKYCFLLDKTPNLSLSMVHTQDTLLADGVDYDIIVTGGPASYFGCAVLQFIEAKYLALNYWVWILYSYDGANSGVSSGNMQSLMYTPGSTPAITSPIMLPRNLTGDMSPILYDGTSLKINTVDYDFVLGTLNDQSYIDLHFTPVSTVQIWFN